MLFAKLPSHRESSFSPFQPSSSSPSSSSRTATKVHAALEPGFCGDCQTFSNAISVCGGSFGPADIEINGEYVLQQAYSKCTCTEVMQRVLWTCAKCELLAGHQSKSAPPQKYQTQCIAWGMTIQEWKAPYTGVVAPGTKTNVTGETTDTPAPGTTTAAKPTTPTGGAVSPSAGEGEVSTGTSSSAQPGSTSDKSVSGDGNATETTSGLNTTAVGVCVGIVGVAIVAGAMATVMMKRRKRRHVPLDLDSLPGLEDKWETPHRPTSPSPPMPIASATPAARGGHHPQYNDHGYAEGSVVGGYDGQYDGRYDGYDQYRGAAPYNPYHGQYGNPQYADYGQYEQNAYPMNEYNNYEHNAQTDQALGGMHHKSGSKADEPGKYL
ncbi:hypothetical protein BGX20_007912 [Mortierella sp. AD010]|nr:hypothetical protein BGX20_007912 [Mortierella sp. AD010]